MKNKVNNYSGYDWELSYDDYDNQESSYLDVKHYSHFVSDEDMEIPKGFDPYSVSVDLDRESNYDEENVNSIINADMDDTSIVAIQSNYGNGVKVKLKRKNAEIGASILID